MDEHLDMELGEFRAQVGAEVMESGPQSLVRLSDEELAILDPGETFFPKPHLSSIDAQQREWVLATALRCLVAREAIEIRNIEELDAVLHGAPQAQVDMHIRVEIDLALTLRRTAEQVLAVSRFHPRRRAADHSMIARFTFAC